MKTHPRHMFTMVGAAAVLAVCAVGGTLPAQSQEVLAQQTAPTADMDDETLRAFAQATIDVEAVVDKWSGKIGQTADADESADMRQQANEEVMEAVRSNGISMETYNRVYQTAQSDPNVATTIQAYRREMQ